MTVTGWAAQAAPGRGPAPLPAFWGSRRSPTPPGAEGSREGLPPASRFRPAAPFPAGIDGESARLDSPLIFESLPATLRARIASQHPGASPSAGMPENATGALRRLVELALGRAANRT